MRKREKYMLRLTGVLLIFLAFSSIGMNISSGIKRKLERNNY